MSKFDKLINLYEKKLNIPNNKYCEKCDSFYKEPLLPWVIGEKYYNDENKIFIAGKPHRGSFGNIRESNVIDARVKGEELFFNEKWPYWNYTKEILNSIYLSPKESWEHIVFSNVVKCSSTDTRDLTTLNCANQCIKNNKVIILEIELLRPKIIIFYTWSMYRVLFEEIPFAQKETIQEITNRDHRIKCGAKKLGWWDRTFISTWGEKIHFLILGHPERMKKDEYIKLVSDWLLRYI